MSDYNDMTAIYNDSNLRLTMERYSYNLWGLIALVGAIVILRIMNQTYLYNAVVIFIVVAFFTVYFTYMKND